MEQVVNKKPANNNCPTGFYIRSTALRLKQEAKKMIEINKKQWIDELKILRKRNQIQNREQFIFLVFNIGYRIPKNLNPILKISIKNELIRLYEHSETIEDIIDKQLGV